MSVYIHILRCLSRVSKDVPTGVAWCRPAHTYVAWARSARRLSASLSQTDTFGVVARLVRYEEGRQVSVLILVCVLASVFWSLPPSKALRPSYLGG